MPRYGVKVKALVGGEETHYEVVVVSTSQRLGMDARLAGGVEKAMAEHPEAQDFQAVSSWIASDPKQPELALA